MSFPPLGGARGGVQYFDGCDWRPVIGIENSGESRLTDDTMTLFTLLIDWGQRQMSSKRRWLVAAVLGVALGLPPGEMGGGVL